MFSRIKILGVVGCFWSVFHVFYFQLNDHNFRERNKIIPRFMIKEIIYFPNHGECIIPKSITTCIYHAKFLRFLNCRVSNTKDLHDLRTWWNSEHLIWIDTKMKQLGVFDSLGIANDQIKHLSRVVFLGR